MVRFLNPDRPASQQVRVWCEPLVGGFRLVRRNPDGDLRAERYTDRAALHAATVRLQTMLTSAGWRPAGMPRTPLACRHGTRAGQFHR